MQTFKRGLERTGNSWQADVGVGRGPGGPPHFAGLKHLY
jgi:hypothetical protein